MWSHLKVLPLTYVEQYEISFIINKLCVQFMVLCCKISFIWIYAVLSQNRFVAIYALLRGENLSQKLCLWRKNDKYQVWGGVRHLGIFPT